MGTPLEDLSTEMISKIAMNLNSWSIYRLCLTSKRLSRAAQSSLYTNVAVSGTERILALFTLLSVSRPELQCLIRTMVILRHHAVKNPSLIYPTPLPVLPNCRHLYMNTWLGSHVMAAFPSLHTLHLHGFKSVWLDHIRLQLPRGKKEHFELQTSSPALTTLRLTGYSVLAHNAEAMWKSLRGRLTSLEIIAPLYGSNTFWYLDVEALSACSSTLTFLKIRGVSLHGTFDKLATILPHLQRLSINVGSLAPAFYQHFEYLWELELDTIYHGSKDSVDLLLRQLHDVLTNGFLPRLKHLRITVRRRYMCLESIERIRNLAGGLWTLDVGIAKWEVPDERELESWIRIDW